MKPLKNRFATIRRVRVPVVRKPRHQYTLYLSDEENMRLADMRLYFNLSITDTFKLMLENTYRTVAKAKRRSIRRAA